MALALGPLPAHGGELIPVLQNPSLDKMRWTMTIALAVWHHGCLYDKQILGILEKYCSNMLFLTPGASCPHQ